MVTSQSDLGQFFSSGSLIPGDSRFVLSWQLKLTMTPALNTLFRVFACSPWTFYPFHTASQVLKSTNHYWLAWTLRKTTFDTKWILTYNIWVLRVRNYKFLGYMKVRFHLYLSVKLSSSSFSIKQKTIKRWHSFRKIMLFCCLLALCWLSSVMVITRATILS